MKKNLEKAFRDLLLEEMHKPGRLTKIRNTVAKRLGCFPEYRDVWDTAEKCKSHILKVVDKQFDETEGYSNREKFKNRKLINMQVKKGYIKKYLTTAVHTYCTAKQVKCNQGQEAFIDDQGNVLDRARKRGKAARAIDGHDKLERTISSSSFGLSDISDDAIAETEQYLKKLHLNDKEIRCFWDRLAGQTFVAMDKEYQESKSANADNRADLYRNRYNRLMKKIGHKRDKVFDLLTRDSHLSSNHALTEGSFFVATDVD